MSLCKSFDSVHISVATTHWKLGNQARPQLWILRLLERHLFSLTWMSRVSQYRPYSSCIRQYESCNTIPWSTEPSCALFIWLLVGWFCCFRYRLFCLAFGASPLATTRRPLTTRLVIQSGPKRLYTTNFLVITSSAYHNQTVKSERLSSNLLYSPGHQDRKSRKARRDPDLSNRQFESCSWFSTGIFTQQNGGLFQSSRKMNTIRTKP